MSEAAASRPPADFYDAADSDNVCLLCGEPRYELVHEVRHFGFPFRFQRCACGLVKQTPMPNRRFFEWFFNSDLFFSARRTGSSQIWGFYDYFKDEPSRLATSRRRFRRLRRYFPSGRPLDLLKIGPSTGTFLHVAQRHGHRAIGCDISSRFVEFARDTYGVEIRHGRFEELGFEAGAFDVVLLFNVIENVPNPGELLGEVHRVLAPGGLFVLNYVDMERNWLAAIQGERYFLFRPPICYIFNRRTMSRILRSHGFETVATLRDVRFLTLEKIATLLGWRWLLRVARWLGLAERTFPMYAYPSRIVVARKAADGSTPASLRENVR